MRTLKQEFKAILEQYGYPVLLVRTEKKVRCTCFDRKTQSSLRSCPRCFGMGYVPIVEKHTVREMDTGVPQAFPLINEGRTFGDMSVSGRAYFFMPEAEVRSGDLIMEVAWKKGYPVLAGGSIWEVSHVDPQRFERGELIFQKVYVKENPVEMAVRGFNIRQVADITSYELIREEDEQ